MSTATWNCATSCSGFLVLLIFVRLLQGEFEWGVEGHDMTLGSFGFIAPMALCIWCVGQLLERQRLQFAEEPEGLPPRTRQLLMRCRGGQGQLLRSDHSDIDNVKTKEIFRMLDTNSQGYISLEDLQRGLKRQEVCDFITVLDDPVFNALLERGWPAWCRCCPTGISKVFRALDKDKDGFISEEEWSEHMHQTEVFLLRFEFRAQLLSRRRFWAMGPEDDTAVRGDDPGLKGRYATPGFLDGLCGMTRDFQLYRNDFLFNAGNNHPLLCLWYGHDDNLLTSFEHFIVELFAISCTVFVHFAIDGTKAVLAADGIIATGQPGMSEGLRLVLDFLIGQFMIASPSMLFSGIAGLLLGWPIIPKRALHSATVPYSVRLGRFCFKIFMIFLTLLFPCALFLIARQGNLVRWTVFRMVAYIEWFPMHVFREYLPIQLPRWTCIGRCLGKWWKERAHAANVKPKVVTSCDIRTQICSSVGWLILSLCLGFMCLTWRTIRQR